MYQDICNVCRGICHSKESLKDYEEKLLDKCFDHAYDTGITLGMIEVYEPPFLGLVNTI